jgi:hypothetical protein
MIFRMDPSFEYALAAIGKYGNAQAVAHSWLDDDKTSNLVKSPFTINCRNSDLRTTNTDRLAPQDLKNFAELELSRMADFKSYEAT